MLSDCRADLPKIVMGPSGRSCQATSWLKGTDVVPSSESMLSSPGAISPTHAEEGRPLKDYGPESGKVQKEQKRAKRG